jgi:hypothetical protein
MSFWNLSDNKAVDATGNFESGGGDIEPIPANTTVLAAPDEAKLDDYQFEEYISLRWTVLAPKEYANRKIFQKIRVFDKDPKKADKAKRMLAAIDANAGGQLVAAGKEPDNALLTKCLVNKPMLLKLQVWEVDATDGSGKKRGNWVSAVAPKQAGTSAPAPAPAPAPAFVDSDVPF